MKKTMCEYCEEFKPVRKWHDTEIGVEWVVCEDCFKDLLNDICRGSSHVNKYKGIPDAKIKVSFIDCAYKKGSRK